MRCTGHCCRGFALDKSYDELQEEYRAWKIAPESSKIPQIEVIAQMVIPVRSSPECREYTYTCKNLDAGGNCTIYETRPQMCRDFPDSSGCHFWRCTSDQSVYFGKPFFTKILMRWKWLRHLS